MLYTIIRGQTKDLSSIGSLQQHEIRSSMDGVIKVDNFELLKNIKGLKNISTTEFRLLSHDYSLVIQQTVQTAQTEKNWGYSVVQLRRS